MIPLDVIKTRMQTDAAAAAGGTVAAAAAIFRDAPGRGLLRLAAFFNGLPPTAVGYLLQGGTKFGGYEMLKQRAYARLRDEGGEERVRKWQLPVMLSSAASAEMLATVAAAGATSRWPHSLARALALLTGAGLPSRAAGARACSRGWGDATFASLRQVLLAPMEVLKLRMQTDASAAAQGVLRTFSQIVQRAGW